MFAHGHPIHFNMYFIKRSTNANFQVSFCYSSVVFRGEIFILTSANQELAPRALTAPPQGSSSPKHECALGRSGLLTAGATVGFGRGQ